MAAPAIKYTIGNSASTTLSTGMTTGDTTTPLTSSTNFQAKSGEGMIKIDEGQSTEEFAYSTGIAGGALTTPVANRGLEGGSAQAHTAQGTVRGIITAGMWNGLVDSVLNILNQTTGAVKSFNMPTAGSINDANGNELVKFPSSVSSAVNEVTVTNAATGNAPSLTATGGDTDIALTLAGKGAGGVKINGVTQSATAPSAGQVLTASSSSAAAWATPSAATDGWTADTNTWVYASASTFTIAGVDVTAQFTKGTRLKFTNTTLKYAVVVSSSFSTNTTVTIAVNTDYVIANAAISSPYYSYQASPQGYPDFFAFTSTIGGFTTGTATLNYSITGARVFILLNAFGGTSNATTYTFTVPVAANITNNGTAFVACQDNGALQTTPGNIEIQNSTTANAFKSFYNTAWTNAGAKNLWGQFQYRF